MTTAVRVAFITIIVALAAGVVGLRHQNARLEQHAAAAGGATP